MTKPPPLAVKLGRGGAASVSDTFRVKFRVRLREVETDYTERHKCLRRGKRSRTFLRRASQQVSVLAN